MDAAAARPAGLARRLAASVYESLLLTALLIGVGFALLPLVSPTPDPAAAPMPSRANADRSVYAIAPEARHLSAAVIFAVGGIYCGWFWSAGRRSLAMKTWRLALATASGGPVTVPTATLRYLACWVGPALAIASYQALEPLGYGRWASLLLAVNYAWAFIDRDRLFLQDRVARTRLVLTEPGR